MISDLTFTVLSFSHLESDLWVEGNKSQHIVSKYWDFFLLPPEEPSHQVAMPQHSPRCHGSGGIPLPVARRLSWRWT